MDKKYLVQGVFIIKNLRVQINSNSKAIEVLSEKSKGSGSNCNLVPPQPGLAKLPNKSNKLNASDNYPSFLERERKSHWIPYLLSLVIASIGLLIMGNSYAQAEMTLDQLLLKVKAGAVSENLEHRRREEKFLKQKSQQKKLLQQAKLDLAQEEKKSVTLSGEFSKWEKTLSQEETNLDVAIGEFGEMFGVVRQVAGDLKGQLETSVTSSEIMGRAELLSPLAKAKSLPSIADLESLWFELQREMTESGKISIFMSDVVKASGDRATQKVFRVGSFNLVSEGKYLSYNGVTKQLIELPRQPASKFVAGAEDLVATSAGQIVGFGMDPSRGALLSLLVQSPSILERLEQGGLVGYVILGLLALGLGLVIERWVVLRRESKKLKNQLDSADVIQGNALGEMLKVFKSHQHDDTETIELKLDEIIIKSRPIYTRGIATLKLLSAVAPLMGLLGTVTGMIVTFQSITLFGTGDPKLMAGGISTALITTVLGLVCAIPLLLLHNMIAAKAKSLVQILEEQSAGLLAKKLEQSSI